MKHLADIQKEVLENEHLFMQDERELFDGSPHVMVEKITVRTFKAQRSKENSRRAWAYFNERDSVNTKYTKKFPAIMEMVRAYAKKYNAIAIGRVMIVRLGAGGSVSPHRDEGLYPTSHIRFHAGVFGSYLYTNILISEGDIMQVDNLNDHSVFTLNGRTAVIFDLKMRA